MHSIKTALLLAAVVFLNISLFAQKDEPKTEKKVIIIKKTDINGNVNEERIEAEGDDADRLMREMDLDKDLKINGDVKTINTNKNVSVTIDDNKNQTIKIVTTKNGKKEVVEWTGKEGEMPAEIKEQIESIEVQNDGNGQKTVTVIVDGDKDVRPDNKGKKMIFIADGDDEITNDIDMPTNVKIDKRYKRIENGASSNKVTLGINIDDADGEGVVVANVMDGSAAAKAGVRNNDIILKVDNAYIFSADGLLKSLRAYNKGDTAKLTVLRGGKEKKLNVVF